MMFARRPTPSATAPGPASCSVLAVDPQGAQRGMEMHKDEGGTVRSVERALAIVELLGEHQELGLEELHYLTGLPKATVSRLLHTLLEQGWLYRGLCDRRYRLCSRRLFGDP